MASMADQFRAFLEAKEEAIKAEALKAQEANAKQFAREVRRKVPVEEGDLKRSIKVTPGGERTPAYSRGGAQTVPEGTVMVTAGNEKVRYGHIVEHGSKKMRGRKFWWPTVKMLRQKFRNRNKAALRKAIKK
ncbi:HK97 gp10 family phage protein [Xanthobacter autotrophicus]|uniref:HK97 gp10 family phage protein n=1 Tax=Xanthobacter TaxID=279 RepID=UPI0024AADD5C|nr:HK97 gp10 family phage protein [Xanthobacter autotrophicus]MDI4664343.1 HK97 gp10 family phage protein [Xanthobacter autotrophicus]